MFGWYSPSNTCEHIINPINTCEHTYKSLQEEKTYEIAKSPIGILDSFIKKKKETTIL